jgi:SpoVK/Ycf46/Vps4 family AAA+-type ATPase
MSRRKPESVVDVFAGEMEQMSTKFNKNDLFQVDNKKLIETVKAFTTLKKYGFSKKTVALTKKYNLQLKKDLKITDTEYLVLLPILLRKQTIFAVSGILKLTNSSDQIAVNLYKLLFDLYHKHLLAVHPAECDIAFSSSFSLLEYINTNDFAVKDTQLSLKQVIRLMDTFANLYNSYKQLSMMAEYEILNILSTNSQYGFCSKMLEVFAASMNDVHYHCFVFYIICHMIMYNTSISLDSDLIDMFCKFDDDRSNIINDIFLNENHPLYKMKIFDRAIDDSGKADKNSIEIHADFKRQYLHDVIKEKRHEDVITSEKIVKKDMFYNEENQKQINDLMQLLQPKQFVEIKQRLKDAGTRTGFACIFSGPAGTGKTETVLQIAKDSGRDIIKVDMASLRSKWWGEDEKNVKAIFSNYKSVLQDSKLEPILLLNEADAIIGKRLDVGGNNGAIITSINAVQNIILEELENFEGILIATTNLTQNMDSAFERRFLYKIAFEKPNMENKVKLWESIVKISEEEAKALANQFDFTGAQIENIFRKKTANSILYGNSYDLKQLVELCKEEKIDKETRIGFGS